MKSLVHWAVTNTPAVNVIVIATLVTGFFSFLNLRREVFPEFELEIVLVSVPYPGASPSDAEKGVCQPVEEAVRALDGIKRLVSIAREGGGFVIIELNSNVRDVQKVVNEVRSRVNRITNFPDLAEEPQVEQITFREPAIRVAVIGKESNNPDAERNLRDVAERVREELLELDSVSQANILGAKLFQIDVEVPEETLRKYGLTLSSVAQILRRENIEMPGGQLKADGQEILLRGKNRREVGEQIAQLPVITQPNGVVLKITDIGVVKDHFEDKSVINEVNGKPALVVSVDRTAEEDLLTIANEVRTYAETAKEALEKDGYELQVWGDTSIDVADRMRLLRDNGIQGLLLVFILLALFLDFRLAFWVSMGIPISVLGAGIVLYMTGQTLNMLSMFAFLMALGIVVDDAIVIGENIYSHRQMGKNFVQAALDGTTEVIPSVISSVSTTIIAFIPFFFVSGVMGKFIAVMPVAIIAMLSISLIEAATSLPCHLSHAPVEKPKTIAQYFLSFFGRALNPIIRLFDLGSKVCGGALDWFGDRIYLPILRFLLTYPLLGVSGGLATLLVTVAVVNAGYIPFEAFPKSDSNQILAQVVFPDGTPVQITDRATKQIEEAVRKVSEEIYAADVARDGEEAHLAQRGSASSPDGPVKLTFRQVGEATSQGAMGSTGNASGSHVGQVYVELVDSSNRTVSSTEFINMWRQESGQFNGAERVTFDAASIGPGGNPIEFRLLAPTANSDQLEAAVEEAKAKLATYAGVYDIRDDATPGKTEFQIRVKDRAQAMGITSADLAETIRNSYYGAEVMRLQRGRHEVKLMVRYPEDERNSLVRFDEIRVRGNDGVERPITELAERTVAKGYSEINRLNQRRSVTITSNLDTTEANASQIITELKNDFFPQLIAEKYPAVAVNWEGQQKQTEESLFSLAIGCGLALLAIYVLLVMEFRSYFQPLLIMAIIPFGVVGAVWGHGLMGIEVTLFSFFGLVALTGVVVNDSIVLVDFINARIRSGIDVQQALLEAGRRRMRPVFLTSVTTIGGLAPMLMETSFQAQFLVPMATSIAFGLMLSTVLVLFQVPVFFQLYVIASRAFGIDPNEIDHTEEMLDEGRAAAPQLGHVS